VPMKRQSALLPLAVFITFAAAQTGASRPAPTSLGTRTPDPAPQTLFLKPTLAAACDMAPAKTIHLFTLIFVGNPLHPGYHPILGA
jgi:hypothetical protein